MGSINLYENGVLNSLNGAGVISCVYEEAAAALKNRSIGDILYIKINNVFGTYKVIKAITKDDPITTTGANANVEEFNSVGKQLFVKDLPKSGGGGGEGGATVLKTFYVPSHTTEAVAENLIIYFSDKKLYKVIKTGGLPADYDVVVATDLELADLDEDVLVTVEGVPGPILTAADVSYEDTTVKNELDQINSNLISQYIETTISSSDTYGDVLTRLQSLIDYSKITYHSVLDFANSRMICTVVGFNGVNDVSFARGAGNPAGATIQQFYISTSIVAYELSIGSTRTDQTNELVPSIYNNFKIRIYY